MSETFKRNYVWYRLAGKSEQALRRVLEIDSSGEGASKEVLRGLAEQFGYFFPVSQQGKDCAWAVFPAVFAHPFGSVDEFYIKCPIGPRKDAPDGTHFVPEDGVLLTDEEMTDLERVLFPAWGASMPIIDRQPIPFTPAPPKSPAGPQP